MPKKKTKIVRGWAIVRRGKIIRHDGEGLAVRPLLIFTHRWLAEAAVWTPSEKVAKLEIHILP